MEFSISGPGILLRIPTGIPFLGDILITETLAVSWLVMLLVTGACIWICLLYTSSSASPYYDATIEPLPYDPEKAKALLEESGWDSSQVLRFCVDSGDSTFVNAASIIVAQWAAVGIQAQIQTMDINTLMSTAGSGCLLYTSFTFRRQ